jgi:hypothetical protein
MLRITGQESPDRHRLTAGIKQWMTSAIDRYSTMEYTLPTWVNLMMYRAVVVMAAESRFEQLTLDGGPALTVSRMYIDIEFISCSSAVARLHSKLNANSELA